MKIFVIDNFLIFAIELIRLINKNKLNTKHQSRFVNSCRLIYDNSKFNFTCNQNSFKLLANLMHLASN